MPFCQCFVCSLRKFNSHSEQINTRQQFLLSSELATELEDSRKFSLNSLMALLAILAISGSKVLQPVALTILIYTINLRLAINTCFLRNYPALSRFLHIIPLLSTFCAAGIELISGSQSPALVAVGLLLGTLPFIAMAIHHGGQCIEASTAELPMRVQDVAAPVSSSVDATLASA